MHDEKDALVFASDKPDVSKIIEEYQRCGQSGDYFTRSKLSEETRFAKWDSQNDDSKKHAEDLPEGEEVFPFEGASDVRCYQSDEVCNELVAVDLAAFWRAQLKVSPVGPEDTAESSAANTFMDWLRKTKLRSELETEVELSAQFRHGHSWCALHVTWEREVAKKLRKVLLSELSATSQSIAQLTPAQIPPQYAEVAPLLAIFPDLIAREDSESQAIAVLQVIYRTYVKQGLKGVLPDDDIPELSNKRARIAIRELREKGETEIPWPYLCKNQPCIRALKPWRDIVVNNYCADIQQHPYIFLPIYLAENEFRAMAKSDGWETDFVELAVKTKGKCSAWGDMRGDGISTEKGFWQSFDAQTQEIELLWVYQKLIDDDGIAGIHYTICSPHIEKQAGDEDMLCAKHGLLNYPGHKYPVVIVSREKLDRFITATRSVPEILLTSQREEKVQRDSLVDLTSLSVVPPLNIPKGSMQTRYKFGPAIQNEVHAGREPKLMEIPTKGMVPAIETMKIIDYKKNRYFGLFDEEVPPDLSTLLMEKSVRSFLTAWGQSLYMAYLLSRKFAPELIERVTGFKPPPTSEHDYGEYDCNFMFDVTAFNNELFLEKLKAFSSLIPDDSEGVIDKGNLVRIKANYIDPNVAAQLVTDKSTASEKILRDVQQDFAFMYVGNQPNIRDASNDPTAATRLEYAVNILKGNPRYLSALNPEIVQQLFAPHPPPPQLAQQSQPDILFNKSVEQYLQNLEQGSAQQRNKITGRTGVKQ